ncbi:nucleotidyltransferase family protein [Candidatus Poribacteria bacterium]
MRENIAKLKNRIIPVLQQHGVIHAAIFGSFARGEEREDSDLDILVELRKGKTLLDLVALKLELERVLERKIDITTRNALQPGIKERILEEQIAVI